MRIVVNTRLLLKDKLEGIGWFTYETLQRITTQHPEHEFIFLFDRPYHKSFLFNSNVKAKVLFPPARSPFLWNLYFHYSIPFALKSLKADFYLSTEGYFTNRCDVKSVNVIHDLNFVHYPAFLPKNVVAYYQKYYANYATIPSRIATVSEYTKNDVHQTYGVDLDKIDVVYNGIHHLYHSKTTLENKETILKYSNNCPYFIFVGLIHPRKNLKRSIEAFEIFKRKTGNNFKFLIVGEWKYDLEGLRNTVSVSEFKDDIVFLGRKSPMELSFLLSAASALIYTPIFEGFGIPIIEAFKSKTPVITSNVTSMPEVAASGALIVDPFSANDIAKAMVTITLDDALRHKLVQIGEQRAKDFSWDKTAQLLWKSIERAM